MAPSNFAQEFAAGLNRLHAGYDFDVLPGRRYDRIVVAPAAQPDSRSVHAFVVRDTGQLVKPASYKAPQRDSEGNLAVRYSIATPSDLTETLRQSDTFGAYLYAS